MANIAKTTQSANTWMILMGNMLWYKRCRSASGCFAALHNPRLTDPSQWLQAGKTVDILRCAAESTDLLLPSALPRSLRSLRLSPPSRPAGCRLPPVIVLPLRFFVFVVVVVQMLRMDYNQEGSACAVVLLLYVLLYYMGRRHNTCSLYILLVLLEIWRLLMIPAFGEIKTCRSFLP